MARTKVIDPGPTLEEVKNAIALGDHHKALVGFANALDTMDKGLPARATGKQIAMFAQIIARISEPKRAGDEPTSTRTTMTELRDSGAIGYHMNKSYQMFLPSVVEGDGQIGWLTLIPDRADGRKKYLTLTPEGLEVARAIAAALEGAK